MGMFSWNCKVCGHPLLSPEATEDNNEWMSEGVALSPHKMAMGIYDGYGRLSDMEINDEGEPEVYHRACWNLVGEPTDFSDPSELARDQGWFFDDNVHNLHKPQNENDLKNLKIAGDLAQENCNYSWRVVSLEYLIDKVHEHFEAHDCEDKELREDIARHIENRKKREDRKEAERLGISTEEFYELEQCLKESANKDEPDEENVTRGFIKAKKMDDKVFRLTSRREVVADFHFAEDKVYMVEDPWGEIEPGTERENWL